MLSNPAFLSLFLLLNSFSCKAQVDPDSWSYEKNDGVSQVVDNNDIPPDLRIPPKIPVRGLQAENSAGIGEWFYRRILGIVLKGGQVKENEDGSVDVALQMKLQKEEYTTLENYLKSTSSLCEDKLRRSLGYIEQSIYKPSFTTKIMLAWSEYINLYLTEYKTAITWSLALLAVLGLLFWIWRHMSHRNAIILVFMSLYTYEVFISYKEAEQKELEAFVAALNNCKWKFWSSTCDLPNPDPLIFLKHMNPLKICIRMFTSVISEPMIMLSDTVKVMTHGITDGLWSPFDVIVYGILIIVFNLMLIFFLFMVVFNFILNIPFNLSFLGGLVNVGLAQRKRTIFTEAKTPENRTSVRESNNTLSGPTLEKLLDVCSRALSTNNSHTRDPVQFSRERPKQITFSPKTGMRRSSSTGRLPNSTTFEGSLIRRNVKPRTDGSGDVQ